MKEMKKVTVKYNDIFNYVSRVWVDDVDDRLMIDIKADNNEYYREFMVRNILSISGHSMITEGVYSDDNEIVSFKTNLVWGQLETLLDTIGFVETEVTIDTPELTNILSGHCSDEQGSILTINMFEYDKKYTLLMNYLNNNNYKVIEKEYNIDIFGDGSNNVSFTTNKPWD